MKFKELEFKYRADDIALSEFRKFCEQDPHKFLVASGYDYFYENVSDPTSFCRHRVGPDANQLTFKRKTSDKNNYLRDEDNLDLIGKMTLDQVKSLCEKFGYRYTNLLFKNCFIYKYNRYTFVYYICYDKDMQEVGRFIEIEMDEKYAWPSEQVAWAELVDLEQKLAKFNIYPQSRIKRSLFEMFIQGKADER
jgi:adenylate cyclase class IV